MSASADQNGGMPRRLAALVLSLAALVSACGGGDDDGSGGGAGAGTDITAPTDDSDLLEPLADDVLLDPVQAYLDPDGNLTFEGAKALFGAVFTPLPGVEPAPDGDIHEATSIFMVLWAHHDELTPEQQQVFESVALAGDMFEVGAEEDEQGGAARSRQGVSIPAAVKQELERAAREAQSYFRGSLGRTLSFPIRIAVLPAAIAGMPMFGDDTLADAQLNSDANGEYCRIRVNYDKYSAAQARFIMAHEVFHCYQFDVTGGEVVPNWVMEGTAEWAAEEMTGDDLTLADNLARDWITTPTRPISMRSYDAVGLYALTTELNVPMYRYVDDLLRRPRIATVRDAVGVRLDIEWALSYAGREGWGAKYALTAGSFDGNGPRRQLVRATIDGGPATFPDPPGSRDSGAQVYSLLADGDVLVISGNGHGGIRFDGADEAEFNGSFVGDFCLKPGGCVCPDGSTAGGEGREITGRGSRSVFIGWGPMGDSIPTLKLQSLDHWCNSEPVPDTTGPLQTGCVIGRWQATRMNIPPVNDLPPIVGGEGMVVEFGADGKFLADYDTMVPIVGVLDEKNGVIFEFRFTGVVPGEWTVDEAGKFLAVGDTSAVRVVGRITEPIEQEVMNNPLSDFFSVGGDATGVYHVVDCSGNVLTITTVYGGGELSIELQRV